MLGLGVDTPADEPNGASRSPSAGLAVLRVLHARIRSGEHDGLMPSSRCTRYGGVPPGPRISMISDV